MEVGAEKTSFSKKMANYPETPTTETWLLIIILLRYFVACVKNKLASIISIIIIVGGTIA